MITINFKQIRQLIGFCGGKRALEEDDTEITLTFIDDGTAHSGNGLYAHYTEYPDEGSVKLDE